MKMVYDSFSGTEQPAWSNEACLGYMIMAMQDCGFSKKEIQLMEIQMLEVFDRYSVGDAEQWYCTGDY